MKTFAADYVTVAERIAAFYDRFPDGSIQTELLELTDARVVVVARAYRSPEDPRPGVGHSSLSIPGATPYTRGSELENAETSAWGRALAALGFETKAGIASADEISAKAVSRPGTVREAAVAVEQVSEAPTPRVEAPRPSGGMTVGEALDALRRAGIEPKAASPVARRLYGNGMLRELTAEQRAHVVEEILGDGPANPVEEDWAELVR